MHILYVLQVLRMLLHCNNCFHKSGSGITSPFWSVLQSDYFLLFGRQQTDKTPDKRWTSVCTANE
jgi:hypothetical protein